MKQLRGKCLVRKTKLTNGTEAVILCGLFHPTNFNVDEIKNNDEMWVTDIIISGGLRFTDPIDMDAGSPEDFLAGDCASPSFWNTKEEL